MGVLEAANVVSALEFKFKGKVVSKRTYVS